GADRAALMDDAARCATRQLRLQEGDFLPFSSGWPALRDGYLAWLASHEAQEGAAFAQAERRAQQRLGGVELVGTLDRVDVIHPAGAADAVHLVIDYKSESAARSAERVKAGCEDTQLAFYAALMPPHAQVRAAYLNVGE